MRLSRYDLLYNGSFLTYDSYSLIKLWISIFSKLLIIIKISNVFILLTWLPRMIQKLPQYDTLHITEYSVCTKKYFLCFSVLIFQEPFWSGALILRHIGVKRVIRATNQRRLVFKVRWNQGVLPGNCRYLTRYLVDFTSSACSPQESVCHW